MKAMVQLEQTSGLTCSIDPMAILAICPLRAEGEHPARTRIDYGCTAARGTLDQGMATVLVINTQTDIEAAINLAERKAHNDALNETSREEIEAAEAEAKANRKKRREAATVS